MITVMKLVSLAVDFNNAPRPNFAQYAGYMLCPANCMLGPWNKYSEYVRVNTFYSPLVRIIVIYRLCVNQSLSEFQMVLTYTTNDRISLHISVHF